MRSEGLVGGRVAFGDVIGYWLLRIEIGAKRRKPKRLTPHSSLPSISLPTTRYPLPTSNKAKLPLRFLIGKELSL